VKYFLSFFYCLVVGHTSSQNPAEEFDYWVCDRCGCIFDKRDEHGKQE
jgi:hypothetical protein